MKKKYRVMTPITVYVLGTLVCFSRFCRAGYLDSCDMSVSYCDGDHVSGREDTRDSEARCSSEPTGGPPS